MKRPDQVKSPSGVNVCALIVDDDRCGKRSCKIRDPIRASARVLHDRRLEATKNGDKEVVAGEENAISRRLEATQNSLQAFKLENGLKSEMLVRRAQRA